jgi:hypothetical protein
MAKYTGGLDLPDGWDELFALREMYGAEWHVFINNNSKHPRYASIKIAANGRVDNKANYWVSWDKEKQKMLSRGKDAELLKKNRPELYDFAVKNLTDEVM